jgi:glycosyltransferase involved in cell wall biosynthesis
LSEPEGTRIAVAMCTYNSEEFVDAQLASILDQTRPPDELVICDDGSSDATMEHVAQFRERAPFEVRVHVNERNLGSTKNFEQAIGLCVGDVVVMSGDDDVWHPEKLQAVEEALGSGAAGLALSDAELVDEELRPTGFSLWEARGFSETDRSSIAEGRNEYLLRKHISAAYGNTMAFRAQHNHALLPIPGEWVEDTWIAVIIAGLARVTIIPRALVKYRQHEANISGSAAPPRFSRFKDARRYPPQTFLDRARQLRLAVDRLENAQLADGRFVAHLRAMERHNVLRARIARSYLRRPSLVARELLSGRYGRYSDGWRSAVLDMVRVRPS